MSLEWLERLDKKLAGFITVVEDFDIFSEDIPPSKYYIMNAFGQGVYFKTRSRAKAQEICDQIYGKGFFVVKQVVVAQVR